MRVEEVVRRIAHAGKGAAAGIGEGLEIGEQRIGRQRRARADRDLVGAARGALDQAVAADGHDIGVVARAARECRRDAAVRQAVVARTADEGDAGDADERIGRGRRAENGGDAAQRARAGIGAGDDDRAGRRVDADGLCRGVERVGAAAADDGIRAGGIDERVVAARADEGVARGVAGELQARARHTAGVDGLDVDDTG